MTVTEIVWFPLKQKVDLKGPSNEATKLLQAFADTILAPGGTSQLFFAMPMDDADVMLWFLDWKSREHHDSFVASE